MSASILTLTSLRNVIADALKARDIFSVGDNVFTSRTERAWNAEGNFIAVYTNSNSFDDGDRSPVVYRVTTDVIVDVVVQGDLQVEEEGVVRTMDIAEQMDTITYAVLNALCVAKSETGIYSSLPFKKVRLTSVQNTLAGNGEMDKGTQRISLEYTWYMELPQLGSPDDEFLLAHTTIIGRDNGIDTSMTFDVNTRGSNG